MSFLKGTPGGYKQIDTLSDEQQTLFHQMLQALQGPGAGGAYGDAADYYRSILSGDPEAFKAFEAPERRRFQQEIIPGLSEQFAGMGAGGLSSSGFRNAAVEAGTDLSERLAQIRANLRSGAASGLANLGSQAFQPTFENVYEKPTSGFLEKAVDLAGQAGSAYLLGPAGPSVYQGAKSSFGKSSPYGDGLERRGY